MRRTPIVAGRLEVFLFFIARLFISQRITTLIWLDSTKFVSQKDWEFLADVFWNLNQSLTFLKGGLCLPHVQNKVFCPSCTLDILICIAPHDECRESPMAKDTPKKWVYWNYKPLLAALRSLVLKPSSAKAILKLINHSLPIWVDLIPFWN